MNDFFAAPEGDTGEPTPQGGLVWKVLVVDDEEMIHSVTSLTLGSFEVDGRPLQLLSARSGREGLEIMAANPDIALAIIDVVMETSTAGLDLVRSIRAELNNRVARLAIRTGQPGQASALTVLAGYDINDYREKTGLTSVALKTAVVAGIRGYRDVVLAVAQRDFYRNAISEAVETIGEAEPQLRTARLENVLALRGSLSHLVA